MLAAGDIAAFNIRSWCGNSGIYRAQGVTFNESVPVVKCLQGSTFYRAERTMGKV